MPHFRPRIVQTETLAAGPAAGQSTTPSAAPAPDWARLSALGFDHALADADALEGAAASSDAAIQALAETTGRHGLQLLLSVSLDQLATSHALWQALPDWQEAAADDLPDPRIKPQAAPSHRLSLRTQGDMSPVALWWADRLAAWAAAGAAGFCLNLDGRAPPEFFAQVIRAVKAKTPHVRFLAWTPGVPAGRVAAIAALPGAPFDAAFSSIAWWDCRAHWLAEEAQRLQPFGSVVALAGAPLAAGGYKPAPAAVTPAQAACRQRLLWLAAFTGDGLLVPEPLVREWMDGQGDESAASLQRALALSAEKTSAQRSRPWQTLSSPDAAMLMLRTGFSDADADEDLVLVANTEGGPLSVDVAGNLARFDGLALVKGYWPTGEAPEGGAASSFAGAEARLYTVRATRHATVPPRDGKRGAEIAARAPRISMEAITPCIDDGRFVAKCSVGEAFTVEADIYGEGHDRIDAAVLWRAVDEESWTEVPMTALVNDRWHASFLLPRVGRYQYQVEAWLDVFGAYRNELDKKTADGQKVDLELREGAILVKAALARAEADERQGVATQLRRILKALEPTPGALKAAAAEPDREQQRRVTLLLSAELHQLMRQTDARAFRVRNTPILQVDAERRAAGFSSWYELFPRSMGKDAHTHGTLRDVIARLPDIQAMGFDTLYFPPIHPIGRKHRKGPNNTLTAGPDDVGSPYAIGSEDGGHDALHPELGTLEDFQALREAAAAHGMELALDFAIQCSPDHPWLKEHPDWFTWRPDGTIRYAENPPKKYQDIVNVDFYAEGAVPGLWIALRDVVLFWTRQGVKVFRVDNPHTKPMPFWEWMIGDIRARHPDAIFLAEAFTRPKPMYRLAKVGFSQSYSYFTWRHGKQEFIDYLTELTQEAPKNFFRPHFFVNTPDIDPYFLQRSGRAGFVIRAALATLLSGLWGMYSGFELCEAAPVPGKEEYLDSEKYELRQRDWKQPGNIIGEITLLNRLRRANPALQSHLGVRFCNSTGDGILCFIKTHTGVGAAGDRAGRNVDRNIVFAAVCLDPHHAQECRVELPLEDWGLGEDAAIICEDLVHGHSFTLRGRHHTISLDPNNLAFTIWRLRPEGGV